MIGIGFQKSHDQGQRFPQIIIPKGPHLDAVMAVWTGGAVLEGPDVLDPIGSHQDQGGIVDVVFDLEKGSGEQVMGGQIGV